MHLLGSQLLKKLKHIKIKYSLKVSLSSQIGGLPKPTGKYVNLKDLGLKGSIWSGNSKPTISADAAQAVQFLDNYLAGKGYKVTYTSAMGGKHLPKSGHYLGHKIDLQITRNGKPARLSSQDEQYLANLGFIGNGAVGWEAVPGQVGGGHYDLNPFRASSIINKYKG